jgi:hypothetical protein
MYTVLLILNSVEFLSARAFLIGPILAWINLDHTNSLSFDLMALSENLESFLYVSW